VGLYPMTIKYWPARRWCCGRPFRFRKYRGVAHL